MNIMNHPSTTSQKHIRIRRHLIKTWGPEEWQRKSPRKWFRGRNMEDKSSRVICQPHEEKVGGWKTQEGGRQGSDLIDALQRGIRWQKTTGSRERILIWRVTQRTSCVLSGSSGQRWKRKNRLGGELWAAAAANHTAERRWIWMREESAGRRDKVRLRRLQELYEIFKVPSNVWRY